MKKCNGCLREVPEDAEKCPHCGFHLNFKGIEDRNDEPIPKYKRPKAEKMPSDVIPDSNGKGGKIGCFVFIGIVIAIIFVIQHIISDPIDKKYSSNTVAKSSSEETTIQACISSWDGQHIRMKREIEKEFKGPKHLYTGMNKPKAKTGETVHMWTCFSVPDRNNRMVKSQVYYKTIVPASKTVNTNDPNWCPVFDVEIVKGCE